MYYLKQNRSPVREGVLRGGIRARLTDSPFSIPLRIPVSSAEEVLLVGNFPTNTSTQFIVDVTLTSNGLTLGIHDDVQTPQV